MRTKLQLWLGLGTTLLLIAVATGCGDGRPSKPAAAQATNAAANPATPAALPPPPPLPGAAPAAAAAPAEGEAPGRTKAFSGTVVETMNALNFTYVLMSTGSEKIWVAGPSTVVKVGDKLSIPSGMEMPNFESKTLNRTFDMIYFVDYLGGEGGADGTGHGASFSGHPPMGGQPGSAPRTLPAGHPPLGMKKVDGKDAGKIDLTGIEKVAGGRTVAEIYAQKAELKGTRVKLRAKVVKFSTQIMERNWLHVQDGTGTEETADLTVTAPVATVAKVGDTVLVEGTLAIDKDFGAGYAYAVILENAQVTVEPPAGK